MNEKNLFLEQKEVLKIFAKDIRAYAKQVGGVYRVSLNSYNVIQIVGGFNGKGENFLEKEEKEESFFEWVKKEACQRSLRSCGNKIKQLVMFPDEVRVVRVE